MAGVVWDHARHDMLVYLIPIGMLVGWSEWIDRGGFGLGAAWEEVVRWAGVVVILCCAPFVLRVVWRTAAFPEGALKDRLEALARAHRVRYHALRVWSPRAPIANAAVIGAVWFSRIILISETLLDRLEDDQIEAVMAEKERLEAVERGLAGHPSLASLTPGSPAWHRALASHLDAREPIAARGHRLIALELEAGVRAP